MRTRLLWFAPATLACAGLLVVGQDLPAAGQAAPPRPAGIRARPGEGRATEFPEPTITQYKPRTTLKTAQHPVPRAKFPVIDIHSHQPTPISDAQFATVVQGMDAVNLRVLVNASGAQGDRLSRAVAALEASRFKNRMVQFTDIDFRNVGPGWAAPAVAQLEADVKAGALGVGEISKAFGLRIRKADGTRLKIDDPELDPIWAACARLGVPVLIHTAEPQEFFEPIDFQNERWLELARFRDRRYPAGEFPRFEELMTERNRMFKKHPKTTFIAAHFAYHANDLARMGTALRRAPERPHRGRRDPGRARPPASCGARVLHQVPGPDPFRQGQLPARRVPLLLAGLRDHRRVFRLLPRLSRVLEALRHGPARRGVEEAVLQERAEARAGAAAGRVAAVMARYLVTGGAGFIGSHLVEQLLVRGHDVSVVDNLSTGKVANLEAATAAARAAGASGTPAFTEGELADLSVAVRAVAGMDYVLHQAAMPSVPRSVADPIASNRANVDATLNVLVAARDAGIRRVVFAGSSSVYGDAAELPKREDMPVQPLSPYALQKLVGEQYLALFTSLYGLETVSTRYFNVFGPRQDPGSPYSGVISLFVRAALDGTAPTIYGDGGQTRDFTYVSNVVDGVLRAAETPGVAGEVINVATNGRVSLNQLWDEVQRLLGTSLVAGYGPVRAGDVRDSQAAIGKAERLLGYQPITSFEEGLRRTVEWAAGRPLPV